MKAILMFIVFALIMMNGTFASGTMEPSKENRQKMAKVHEKMASCLKSNKPMSECRGEMKNNCHKMMGENGCPMMGKMMEQMGGMMKGRKGMMGHGMMNGEEKKK